MLEILNDGLLSLAYLPLGIERLNLTPRDYQEKVVELIADAKEIKASVCAEQIYLWELPKVFTPDSWKKVIEMMREGVRLRNGKGIQISAPPKGSPPEVAGSWVGTTIPFSSEVSAPPMVFVTPELSEQGMSSGDGRCYVVSSPEAVAVLEAHSPQAAEAFKEYLPEWSDEKQVLIFDSDCCEVIELY